ncbi:NAD-dependent epimerase/dehydratase family protein [Natrialbaceae archaeon GCM10025810]|uniref:NAD-dependent epimerase/dehydratase family protein n=1 Tax=Halovalidus salilacus TaxID=3075124 RepID=UPI003615D829
MRREFTAHEGASLREGMNQLDRNGAGTIVVVDDANRLVGIATDGRIRRALFDGASPEAPLSSVVDEDPIVVADDGRSRTVEAPAGAVESIPDDRSLLAPVVDESRRVLGVTTVGADVREVGAVDDRRAVRSVLVVGGAGYVGSVLCRLLLEEGYAVRVLDPLLYGDRGIRALDGHDRFARLRGDTRSIDVVVDAVRDVDAVVHLGGIVGDPACGIDPETTLEYNAHSTRVLASICKYYQVNRFLFASSCSVYGRSERTAGRVDENAPLNPVSLYARNKIESERSLRDLADENFSPTILRMATIYGRSPRMRFDLVGNVLPAKAYEEGAIPVFGGEQFRPNVHVEDVARAYLACLEAPLEAVGDEVFNVGSNVQNYRIDELATIVADSFPDATIEYHEEKTDERSYRVEFGKLRDALGFEAERTVRGHCLEMRTAFESGEFDEYTAPKYNNYASLEDGIPLEDGVPDRGPPADPHGHPPRRPAPSE